MAPDASGAHRTHAQRVPQTCGSPDASHRTHPERPVLTGPMRREGCKTPAHRTRTTGRSSQRPVPIVRCLTLAGPGSLHTGRTDTASGASKPASGECSSARNTPATYPKTSHRRNRKYALYFLKKHRILSLPFKLHLLLKVCQHHKVCTNKCTCVSIFTNIFLRRS